MYNPTRRKIRSRSDIAVARNEVAIGFVGSMFTVPSARIVTGPWPWAPIVTCPFTASRLLASKAPGPIVTRDVGVAAGAKMPPLNVAIPLKLATPKVDWPVTESVLPTVTAPVPATLNGCADPAAATSAPLKIPPPATASALGVGLLICTCPAADIMAVFGVTTPKDEDPMTLNAMAAPGWGSVMVTGAARLDLPTTDKSPPTKKLPVAPLPAPAPVTPEGGATQTFQQRQMHTLNCHGASSGLNGGADRCVQQKMQQRHFIYMSVGAGDCSLAACAQRGVPGEWHS